MLGDAELEALDAQLGDFRVSSTKHHDILQVGHLANSEPTILITCKTRLWYKNMENSLKITGSCEVIMKKKKSRVKDTKSFPENEWVWQAFSLYS